MTVSALLLSLALVLPLRAGAQDGPYPISGTIRDGASGAPIASARITLIDEASGDTLAAPFTTNARGQYGATIGATVSTEDVPLPGRYRVGPISPNPAGAGLITIGYETPGNRPETPVIELYDLLGRRVDGSASLASGVYFYRLRFDDGTITAARSFVRVGSAPLTMRLEQSFPAGSDRPSTAGKTGAEALVARFVVRKAGFAVLETTRTLSAVANNEHDFTLERSTAGRARVILAATDVSADVLPDVLVEVMDDPLAGRTNSAGEVALDSVYTGIPVVLKLSKPGFADQYKRIEAPIPGAAVSVQAVMRRREPVRSLPNIETGAAETGKDGIRIEIPADALIDDEGNAVTGSVSLNMTPVDVSDESELQTFPGAFVGFDENGEQGTLVTFGVAEIVFDQGGRPLNLAPGKTATLELPLYVQRDQNGGILREGDTIPFWSLDEGTGLWSHEAVGTIIRSSESPTGLAVRAEVSHLSWWNLDHVAETAIAWFRAVLGPPLCNLITSGWGRMEGDSCVIPPLGTIPPELRPPLTASVQVTAWTTDDGPPMRGDNGGAVSGPEPPDEPRPTPEPPTPPCPQPPCFDLEFPGGALGFPAGRPIICDFLIAPLPVVEDDPDLGQVVRMKKGKARKTFVLEPGSSPVFEIEFEIESLETGGEEEILSPPSEIERALDAGGVSTYLFRSSGDEVVFLDVCRPFGSDFEGSVLLRSPDGLALDLGAVGSECARVRTVLTETGVYTIRIDNTGNTLSTYDLSLETAPLMELDSSREGELEGEGDRDRFVFQGTAGTMVNAAYGTSEINGAVDLFLQKLDASPRRRARSGSNAGFAESGLIKIEDDGLYEIAVLALSDLQGRYTLGLTHPPAARAFTIDSARVDLRGDLPVLGSRSYHSFDGEAGDMINLVIDRTETGARLSVLSPEQGPDYLFAFNRTVAIGDPEFLETRHFELPESGEWILEVAAKDTGVPLERRTGAYGITVLKPEVEPLEMDSTYTGAFEGRFLFDVYGFTLEEEQTVVIQTTNVSGGFHYTELHGGGARMDRQLALFVNGSSEIERTLPAGDYRIVHENDADGRHEYQMTVRVPE